MRPPIPHHPGDQADQLEATIDHLVPRQKGDLLAPRRSAKAAHTICNNRRHHLPLDHPKVTKHIEMMHNMYGSEINTEDTSWTIST
jgi:hypothetical protein